MNDSYNTAYISWGSRVSEVNNLGLDDQGLIPSSDSDFLRHVFIGGCQPSFLTIKLPDHSLRVNQLECEANYSPTSSAEVKNMRSFTTTPPISFHGMVL
jgi:hypothetical protein